MIGVMDTDLKSFLEKNEKVLEDSYVIVFSDHGHRYASIRETVCFCQLLFTKNQSLIF